MDLAEMNIENEKAKTEASKSVTSAEKIKCSQCNFVTVSKHGLKVHMKKKYTIMNEKYPKNCHIFNKQRYEKTLDNTFIQESRL